jgi:hypothetical protein
MKYRLVDLVQPLSEQSRLRVKVTKRIETSFDGVIKQVKCKRVCAFKRRQDDHGQIGQWIVDHFV